MSGFPINPADRIAQLEHQLTIALASKDAWIDLYDRRERELAVAVRTNARVQNMLALVTQQAREDTEALHDRLDRERARNEQLVELLRESRYLTSNRPVRASNKRARVVYLERSSEEPPQEDE